MPAPSSKAYYRASASFGNLWQLEIGPAQCRQLPLSGSGQICGPEQRPPETGRNPSDICQVASFALIRAISRGDTSQTQAPNHPHGCAMILRQPVRLSGAGHELIDKLGFMFFKTYTFAFTKGKKVKVRIRSADHVRLSWKRYVFERFHFALRGVNSLPKQEGPQPIEWDEWD